MAISCSERKKLRRLRSQYACQYGITLRAETFRKTSGPDYGWYWATITGLLVSKPMPNPMHQPYAHACILNITFLGFKISSFLHSVECGQRMPTHGRGSERMLWWVVLSSDAKLQEALERFTAGGWGSSAAGIVWYVAHHLADCSGSAATMWRGSTSFRIIFSFHFGLFFLSFFFSTLSVHSYFHHKTVRQRRQK